ncbi:hypothetical protein PYK79_15225 [Streptomyces sp. ID05-04B]|uniref:hypothetical protein n=1 Tax=Streptomyces sp. ID05-04B TaxID=3028661 RepID=UPI0029C57B4A|nr:hypothetical protein [Streptomyces sp. ID05-04B]MDX5564402.1 hypothetical protein [Streptomyces sp. ID05-04B]
MEPTQWVHPMGSTQWTPSSGRHRGAHRMTMDATLVRTAMSTTAPGAHPTMLGTLARTRCAAPMSRTAPVRRPADRPLVQIAAGARRS